MMGETEIQIGDERSTLEKNADYVASCLISGLMPPPDIAISEWAERYRMLPKTSTAEHGKWRNERTPYLVEIMNEMSPQSLASDVAFMKAAQVGGTELLINSAFYYIVHDPSPIGLFMPSETVAKRFMSQRFKASARDMNLEKLFIAETEYIKEFPGGTLLAGWSSSESNLRSMPLRIILNDEVSSWVKDCEGFGDPCDLVSERTNTFARKKRLWISTPGLNENCRITVKYEAGDKRKYFVPCPFCGEMQTLEWDNVIWDKDAEGNHLTNTVRMRCPHCHKDFGEFHKTDMLAKGEWRATNPHGSYPSFHLNALYSPLGWFSWKDAADRLVEAHKSKDSEKMKAFVNNVLAEPYVQKTTISIDSSSLKIRREDYGAEVPDGVLALTAGIDTQDNRLEIEVVGWGKNFESWGILKRIIVGDPSQNYVWQTLDAILSQPYHKANGEMLYIAAALQDAMGHKTDEVYSFTGPRESRRIFACKGKSPTGIPITSLPRKTERGSRFSASLVTVGVDTVKDQLFSWMKVETPGEVGYMHFPDIDGYDDEHFAQLCSEKLVKEVRNGNVTYKYVKTRERNEALDLRVYARAALHLLRVDLNKMADAGVSYTHNPMDAVALRPRRIISQGVRL